MKRFATRSALCLVVALCVLAWMPARADDGLVRVPSAHDVATTADRLEAVLAEKGMTVFARIDHAAGAAAASLTLPPTTQVIFGNPKIGTPLMHCQRSIAIDLPQKMLILETDDGVQILYNDPAYLKQRHAVSGCDAVFDKVAGALAAFAAAAGG